MAGATKSRRGQGGKWVAAMLVGGVLAASMADWTEIEFELGYAFEHGHFHGWTPGFAQNHRQAAAWLSRASRAGHPRAQYMLGILYAHGWGAPKSDGIAVEWFARSADKGYGPACYHLGWMYHKGEGVPQDGQWAIRLLEQAAGQGMVAAHLALRRFYERGEGVPADMDQALKRYRLAVQFAQTQPELFDNGAFAERATAAQAALAVRLGAPVPGQGGTSAAPARSAKASALP